MKKIYVFLFFISLSIGYSQSQEETVLLKKYEPIFESIIKKQRSLNGKSNEGLLKEIKVLIAKNKDIYFQNRMKLFLAELNSNTNLKVTKGMMEELHTYIVQHPE